jgi:hypothetical protein
MHSERRSAEGGFALVLALLALLLLTFLGLTLAVTTSTELQIATNYRWSQQAVYAAEAGVEAGKAILRQVAWVNILPPPRVTAWSGMTPPTVAGGGAVWTSNPARRDYEGWQCDYKGNGMGYGVVLADTGTTYQYVSGVLGQSLNGAFTLWVRRPLRYLDDGQTLDFGAVTPPATETDDSNLILVAEGIAPFTGSVATTNLASAGKAVHIIEVALSQTPPQASCRAERAGQQGSGPEGANHGGCETLKGGAEALAGAVPNSAGDRGGLGDTSAN